MSKGEPKQKAKTFLPSTFTARVARSVAERKLAMDYAEEKLASHPDTLAFLAEGEELGWDRDVMLRMRLWHGRFREQTSTGRRPISANDPLRKHSALSASAINLRIGP
jgi:hypothetical protein